MKVREILETGNYGPADDMSINGPYNMNRIEGPYDISTPNPEQEEQSSGFVVVWHSDKGASQEAGPFETPQEAKAWYDDNYGGAMDEEFSVKPFNPKLPVHFDTRNQEDPDEEQYCGQCNGTGEGMYDGTTCYACKGSGIAGGPRRRQARERDPDYERDRRQDAEFDGSGPDRSGWDD